MTTYRNKKNKKQYTVVSEAKMKTHNAWVPCIIYKNEEGESFVREKIDFFNKFTLISALLLIFFCFPAQVYSQINTPRIFEVNHDLYWQRPKTAQDTIICQQLEIERLTEHLLILRDVKDGQMDLMKIKILSCLSYRNNKKCRKCLENLTQ